MLQDIRPLYYTFIYIGGSPCSVVVNVMDSDIIGNEFEFLPHYYIHFRTYTICKGMTTLIPSAMG